MFFAGNANTWSEQVASFRDVLAGNLVELTKVECTDFLTACMRAVWKELRNVGVKPMPDARSAPELFAEWVTPRIHDPSSDLCKGLQRSESGRDMLREAAATRERMERPGFNQAFLKLPGMVLEAAQAFQRGPDGFPVMLPWDEAP